MSVLELKTKNGPIRIQLFEHEAPITCEYFSNAVNSGALARGSIFRIVSSEEHHNENGPAIDVVQIGTDKGLDEPRSIIVHEHSGRTGVRHDRWTVSAARYRPGELYHSFFICLRPEPELDFGGNRHQDGQGFAAFGKVTAGFDIVTHLHRQVEQKTCLAQPIAIDEIRYLRETVDQIA